MNIQPRIDFEGRTKLEEVIPLPAPFLVFLDPSDICNAKCPWCPSGDPKMLRKETNRPLQVMGYELYKRIINQFEELHPVKTLRLYKDGEPLLNQYLAKMVKYAKDSGYFKEVDTTTNGLLLTSKRWGQLVDAGIDKIIISVPQDYTDEYASMIKNAYLTKHQAKIYVKIIGDRLPGKRIRHFLDTFGFADRVFIEHQIQCWPSFVPHSGFVPVEDYESGKVGIYGQPVKEVSVCPYIFYSIAINSSGTVSNCFLDWRHNMLLGDLKKQSIRSIWNGKKLNEFRRAHLKMLRGTIPFCAVCEQLSHGAPDDIDKHAQELLVRLGEE